MRGNGYHLTDIRNEPPASRRMRRQRKARAARRSVAALALCGLAGLSISYVASLANEASKDPKPDVTNTQTTSPSTLPIGTTEDSPEVGKALANCNADPNMARCDFENHHDGTWDVVGYPKDWQPPKAASVTPEATPTTTTSIPGALSNGAPADDPQAGHEAPPLEMPVEG